MTIIQLIQTNKAEDSAKGCWSKYIQSRQKLQFKNTHQKVKASNKQHCLSIFNIEKQKEGKIRSFEVIFAHLIEGCRPL